MTAPRDLSDFVAALQRAHETGARFAPAPGDMALPESRSESLVVQAEVARLRGAVAGFKVAAGTGVVAPVVAPIAAADVVADGGKAAVKDQLGIELEIGFELLQPLPGPGLPEPVEAYFAPRPVIELVDTRLEGESAGAPLLKLADMQINAGLVSGAALEGWDGSDFGAVEARLVCGETVVLDGSATVPGGSALANLRLFCEVIGEHCGGLQPGQVVITGSLCGLPYFPAGTEVSGEISGLGPVAVSLV
ncbi:hydratase [Alloyangia pacifica]|uniref:hydratase n=1 Tax=Alloyangia pacifica TaxID=311180 RepID=UPI001CFF22D7|nr:hydratase [Alloyangia pacifica]